MAPTRTASLRMRLAADQIEVVLRSPRRLPDWNPLFVKVDGPETPAVGDLYDLRTRFGGRGTIAYTELGPGRVEMQWRVRGLVEHAEWLVERVGSATEVTHRFRREGPLAALIGERDRGIAADRLRRLDAYTRGALTRMLDGTP